MGSCCQIYLRPSALDPVICLPLALATLAAGQLSGAVMGALSSDWQLLFPLSFPISPFFPTVWWGPASFLLLQLQLPPLCSQYQNSKIPSLPPTRTNNLPGSSQGCRQHCALGLSLWGFFCFYFHLLFSFNFILFSEALATFVLKVFRHFSAPQECDPF